MAKDIALTIALTRGRLTVDWDTGTTGDLRVLPLFCSCSVVLPFSQIHHLLSICYLLLLFGTLNVGNEMRNNGRRKPVHDSCAYCANRQPDSPDQSLLSTQ